MTLSDVHDARLPGGGSLVVGLDFDAASNLITLSAAGEIDMATASHLSITVTTALQHHPAALDIDLRRVTFLDSTGINALVMARAHAAAVNCRLAVVNPQPFVRRVLEVCGLLAALNVTPDPT